MAQLVIGVDLGGTQIRALLADTDTDLHVWSGRTLSSEKSPDRRLCPRRRRARSPISAKVCDRAATLTRAADGLEAVIGRIEDTVRQVVGDTPWRLVRGIGIGAPGPVDPRAGLVVDPPNLPGWRDVPLRQIMADAFGLPVHLGNDANLAALAEHAYGAGVGVDDLVYVTLSTGIGGGIIAGGQLLLGTRGLAGEIGHQVLVDDGPLCGCGKRGHMEALASGPAIARMAREEVAQGRGHHLLRLARGAIEAIDARLVAQAAREGDPTAQEIIRRAATYVGIGLANVCNMLNPEMIILGGGVSQIGDLLFDTVRKTVAQRAMLGNRQVRIVPAALGDDVVLLGAVALVTRAIAKGGDS